MLKLLAVLAPVLILSGCCQVFGICTSVDVHTSIDRPKNVAQQQPDPGITTDTALGANLSVPGAAACTIASR